MLWKDLELLSSRYAGRHHHPSTKPSPHSREVLQVEACEGLRATPGRSIHNILNRYTYGGRPSGCDPSGIVSTIAHLLSLFARQVRVRPRDGLLHPTSDSTLGSLLVWLFRDNEEKGFGKLQIPLQSAEWTILVIPLVKKGYGLVSA